MDLTVFYGSEETILPVGKVHQVASLFYQKVSSTWLMPKSTRKMVNFCPLSKYTMYVYSVSRKNHWDDKNLPEHRAMIAS